MPRKLALWFALLIVGFLAGFILQYARLQQAQQELSASTKQLGSCQASQQFSQLRDAATVMFLEAVQKNYGKAGEYSKEFFDQAQRIQSSTWDPALRNLLGDTLATRDQITADLAKGDAAALSEIQLILSKIEQTAKH
jgi:type II secretory pathway pseudopilin PulG